MRRFVPLVLVAAAAAFPAASGAGGAKTYLPGCGGTDTAKVKPSKVIIACGDGAIYVEDVDWTHWGAKSATGHGTAKVNTCKPSCAEGTYKSYKADLRASRPRQCTGAGKREWKRLRLTFPDKKPAGVDRTSTQKRRCSD